MTTLQFADTHNLVAFLSKLAKSEGFEEIVDFLNANPIRYELTINLTIYTLCIEQFWAVKAKTVNEEVQLQALVDGKKIIVTEVSVRRDLQLNDEEGTYCLPNATIFEELTRMGFHNRYNLHHKKTKNGAKSSGGPLIYKGPPGPPPDDHWDSLPINTAPFPTERHSSLHKIF
ncbi:hypothetical protein Tco_1130979 [Tanacetum coccineum]